MADDYFLAKVLFFDIVLQTYLSLGLGSVDSTHCYGSVAHAIVSLIFQACGVPEETMQSMLVTIKEIRYFLQTAYLWRLEELPGGKT